MKKEKFIQAVIVEPNQAPRVEKIKNDLKTFQGLVGGYIEKVSFNDKIDMIINEEGKLIELEPNFATKYDIICGPAIFVSHKEEEFSSLPNDWAEFIISCFAEQRRKRD